MATSLALFLLHLSPYAFASPNDNKDKARKIDAVSLECIDCHMGMLTPENRSRGAHYSGYDHLIGIDYAARAAADKSLVRVERLNPVLKLIDGRISCVTCHVEYQVANHSVLAKQRRRKGGIDVMLTIDNKGSALCLSCHNK